MDVVVESGADALSLRELARRAGVSSGAPYRHFADKDAVLLCVATRGFDDLDQTLLATAKRHKKSPAMKAVERLGVTYVRFAAQKPHLFRLMFGAKCPGLGVDSALDEARKRASRHLVQALERVQAEGMAMDAPVKELTELAWAVVHGVVGLHLDGLTGETGVKSAERLAERVVGRLGTLLARAD